MSLSERISNFLKQAKENSEKPDPIPEINLAVWAFLAGAGLVVAISKLALIIGGFSESKSSLIVTTSFGMALFAFGTYMSYFILKTDFGLWEKASGEEKELSEAGKILGSMYDDICILLNMEDESGLVLDEKAIEQLKETSLRIKALADQYRENVAIPETEIPA